MWNKAQAAALNVCTSNPRPIQFNNEGMDMNKVPEYQYVNTQFVPVEDPITKLTHYVQKSTGPAQKMTDRKTGEVVYKAW